MWVVAQQQRWIVADNLHCDLEELLGIDKFQLSQSHVQSLRLPAGCPQGTEQFALFATGAEESFAAALTG
ncbi:MAG: hypothetical protein KAW89_09555, partial [Armatimonadetes bacterium]|nr:hypothetical protein [Armatimonadota bacterium]